MSQSPMLWFYWLIFSQSSPIRYFFVPVTKTTCCFTWGVMQNSFQIWPHSILHHGTLTVLFYLPNDFCFFNTRWKIIFCFMLLRLEKSNITSSAKELQIKTIFKTKQFVLNPCGYDFWCLFSFSIVLEKHMHHEKKSSKDAL